jgi:erythromycin esterase
MSPHLPSLAALLLAGLSAVAPAAPPAPALAVPAVAVACPGSEAAHAGGIPADDDAALVADLAARAVPLASLDPAAGDFADLEPLAAVLAGVDVVHLAEASHGDGSAFLVRRRLLRFLNERLGFDVLAWESGMNDLAVVEALLHGDQSPAQIAHSRIARPWALSTEALGVFEDARRTHGTTRPLEMAGFDVQVGSLPDTLVLGQRMAELFALCAPDRLDDEQRALLEDLTSAAMDLQRHGEDGRRALLQRFDDVVASWDGAAHELSSRLGAREHALLGRSLWSFGRFLHFIAETMARGGFQRVADNTPRDVGMGSNLVWLADEHFGGRRLATWVATFHAARGLPTLQDSPIDYSDLITMGDVVWQELGERSYTLAITCYEGRTGVPASLTGAGEPMDVEPAPIGSLEELCHRTGLGDLFLDLRGLPDDHPLREPRVARVMGHSPLTARWPEHIDGLLVLERMQASTLAEDAEGW